VTIPFALQFVQEAKIVGEDVPYTYDPVKQMNVMPDGSVAVDDRELMAELGTTTSTAGSKTHFDD
jgi:putative ATP-grasp target RiPP